MKIAALILSCISLVINTFTIILMVRNARKLKNIGRIRWKGENK